MKGHIVLEPITGTVEENLDRAEAETTRALNFRGSVTGVKAEGNRIMVQFEVNPKWDLPDSKKVAYLKEWLQARVRMFKVVSIR